MLLISWFSRRKLISYLPYSRSVKPPGTLRVPYQYPYATREFAGRVRQGNRNIASEANHLHNMPAIFMAPADLSPAEPVFHHNFLQSFSHLSQINLLSIATTGSSRPKEILCYESMGVCSHVAWKWLNDFGPAEATKIMSG